MRQFSSRFRNVFAIWFLGVLVVYACSWPAYESRMPDDRSVVSVSAEGRYLATVRTPAKLVKNISGSVQFKGRSNPRGPIEICDARGGAVIRSIDCGADLVDSVHLLDQGNLTVASYREDSNLPQGFTSKIYRWQDDSTQPTVTTVPGSVVACCSDVDGSAIAIVYEDALTQSVAKAIDLRSGKELWQTPVVEPAKICLSRDGKRVVTLDRTETGYTIRVRNTLSGKQVGSFDEPNRFPTALAISHDGSTLWAIVANSSSSEVSLHGWNIESQQKKTSITPSDGSEDQRILKGVYEITTIPLGLMKVAAFGHFGALIRVSENSIEVLDANIVDDLYSEDGASQVGSERDSANENWLVVRNTEDQRERFRLPFRGTLHGLSPGARHVVFQKFRKNDSRSLQMRISELLHTAPNGFRGTAREIYAIELRAGTSRLVGILPPQLPKFSQSDGFIDGGKRVLINNTIWKFPGHRPWAMILLLPTIVVAVLYWVAKRYKLP